jgi:hypothetical protein
MNLFTEEVFESNQLIISLNSNVIDSLLDEFIELYSQYELVELEHLTDFPLITKNIRLFAFNDNVVDINDLIDIISNNPNVVYVALNFILDFDEPEVETFIDDYEDHSPLSPPKFLNEYIPNDPLFSHQWSLKNNTNPGADIKATYAWYHFNRLQNKNERDIVIAVFDTGFF